MKIQDLQLGRLLLVLDGGLLGLISLLGSRPVFIFIFIFSQYTGLGLGPSRFGGGFVAFGGGFGFCSCVCFCLCFCIRLGLLSGWRAPFEWVASGMEAFLAFLLLGERAVGRG